MTTDERVERIREVESVVSTAVGKGWILEEIVYRDEVDEDFRCEIRLRYDGSELKNGIL